MQVLLLQKQVRELLDFFEKYPERNKGLSVREYQNILKGLVYLLRKSPEGMGIPGDSGSAKLLAEQKKEALIQHFTKLISLCNKPECLSYQEVSGMLKLYQQLLSGSILEIANEDFVELAGFLRVLEMERLYVNMKL